MRNFETLEIDKYIVESSGIKNPKTLFIPTASGDALAYVDIFNKVYGEKLECKTDSLLLLSHNLEDSEIKNKILSSDLIYVGGGNTEEMMRVWKEKNVDKYLRSAFENNTVLSGLSAGSICWFKYGHSDSNSFESNDDNWKFSKVEGFSFINAIHCPHYNEYGRERFDKMMLSSSEVGIALENNTAIVFKDDKYKIIKSDKNANAYKLSNLGNGVISKDILDNKEFKDVSKLL
ncbi:peptidase E [Clostridium sp. CCUG 7971]|uniref:Type 1 glutamine amidotransferase-like domain-containing protein n=1 Tax=Clostridium sp. CCUG 7971 TaxID=2811414 RepID=UPI00336BEC2C